MSLKPICTSPKDLEQFSFKEFKGQFFKQVKRLAKKCNSAETAVPFFLHTKQKYSDFPEAFFMVFGKIQKWKKHSKETAAKEEALRGLCYAEENPETGGFILKLMPVAGKVKKKDSLISKALKKVLAPAKCSIELLQGEFSEELLEKAENQEDAEEQDASTEEKEEIPALVLLGLKQLARAIVALKDKEAQKRGGKIRQAILQTLVKEMNNLKKDIAALPEEQRKKIEARKEYQYAKAILDKINGLKKEKEEATEEAKEEQKPQASPEELTEFVNTIAELKLTFSKAGVEFSL